MQDVYLSFTFLHCTQIASICSNKQRVDLGCEPLYKCCKKMKSGKIAQEIDRVIFEATNLRPKQQNFNLNMSSALRKLRTKARNKDRTINSQLVKIPLRNLRSSSLPFAYPSPSLLCSHRFTVCHK